MIKHIEKQLKKLTGIRKCGKSYVTEFSDRRDEIRVYPLSFAEFYSVYDSSEEKVLNEYYTYGGLPLTVLEKTDNAKINYLKKQKDIVYINDIVDRNAIQNKEKLEMLVQIIALGILFYRYGN